MSLCLGKELEEDGSWVDPCVGTGAGGAGGLSGSGKEDRGAPGPWIHPARASALPGDTLARGLQFVQEMSDGGSAVPESGCGDGLTVFSTAPPTTGSS